MTKLVFAVLGIFGLLAVLTVGSFYLFGMSGAALGILSFLGLVYLCYKLLKSHLIGLGKALLESKSRVLRGATAVVHNIKAAPAPKNYRTDHVASKPTCFYFLDVTIAPSALTPITPFSSWNPHELTIIPFDAKAPDIDSDGSADYGCEIHEISFITDQKGEEREDKTASTRLKLYIEIPERADRLKFLYYFETFGDLQIS